MFWRLWSWEPQRSVCRCGGLYSAPGSVSRRQRRSSCCAAWDRCNKRTRVYVCRLHLQLLIFRLTPNQRADLETISSVSAYLSLWSSIGSARASCVRYAPILPLLLSARDSKVIEASAGFNMHGRWPFLLENFVPYLDARRAYVLRLTILRIQALLLYLALIKKQYSAVRVSSRRVGDENTSLQLPLDIKAFYTPSSSLLTASAPMTDLFDDLCQP